MVLFFIVYLIIIIIFCSPFSIKIAFFINNTNNRKYFAIKIGYVSIPIQKFNIEKKKKPDKRKKKKLRVKFKGFHIKKLIEYKILLEINLPEYLNGIIEELKFKFLPLSYMLRLMPELNIDCNSTVNAQNFIYFQTKISLKTNLFLIFSSILQTLTIGRK